MLPGAARPDTRHPWHLSTVLRRVSTEEAAMPPSLTLVLSLPEDALVAS